MPTLLLNQNKSKAIGFLASLALLLVSTVPVQAAETSGTVERDVAFAIVDDCQSTPSTWEPDASVSYSAATPSWTEGEDIEIRLYLNFLMGLACDGVTPKVSDGDFLVSYEGLEGLTPKDGFDCTYGVPCPATDMAYAELVFGSTDGDVGDYTGKMIVTWTPEG